MIRIEPVRHSDFRQIQKLINGHLGAMIPGWGLPADFIASRLRRNPDEYVVDPWVIERQTLAAHKRDRVCGMVHLLRYGDRPEVSDDFRNAGEMVWFVVWPEEMEVGRMLLDAAHAQLEVWQVEKSYFDGGLPGPMCTRVRPHGVQCGVRERSRWRWPVLSLLRLECVRTPQPCLA